jgi:hypothetical protein
MNKVDIQDVLVAVKELAPLPNVTTINWEYPGYIHIGFPVDSNPDYYIALGENLGTETGYSWNDTEGTIADSIEDLDSADNVALAFWGQVIKELGL